MEYQEILNLLRKASDSRLTARKSNVINDQSKVKI